MKEQIRSAIEKVKTFDIASQEGRQKLIAGFINAVYLYDDKITIVFNYKDSTTTVGIDEYKSSDHRIRTAPTKERSSGTLFIFTKRTLDRHGGGISERGLGRALLCRSG